jgi:hypothetical protein
MKAWLPNILYHLRERPLILPLAVRHNNTVVERVRATQAENFFVEEPAAASVVVAAVVIESVSSSVCCIVDPYEGSSPYYVCSLIRRVVQ